MRLPGTRNHRAARQRVLQLQAREIMIYRIFKFQYVETFLAFFLLYIQCFLSSSQHILIQNSVDAQKVWKYHIRFHLLAGLLYIRSYSSVSCLHAWIAVVFEWNAQAEVTDLQSRLPQDQVCLQLYHRLHRCGFMPHSGPHPPFSVLSKSTSSAPLVSLPFVYRSESAAKCIVRMSMLLIMTSLTVEAFAATLLCSFPSITTPCGRMRWIDTVLSCSDLDGFWPFKTR